MNENSKEAYSLLSAYCSFCFRNLTLEVTIPEQINEFIQESVENEMRKQSSFLVLSQLSCINANITDVLTKHIRTLPVYMP
jgi:hypothetical protein